MFGMYEKAKGKVKLLVECLFFLGLRVTEALTLKKRDVTHGPRLTFSVIGKGQKQRDVLAGRIVSKRIWTQIKHLSDDEYEYQFNMLYTAYSLPNVILPFFGACSWTGMGLKIVVWCF